MHDAFDLFSNSAYLFTSKIQMNVVLYTFLRSIYTSVYKALHLQIQCNSSCLHSGKMLKFQNVFYLKTFHNYAGLIFETITQISFVICYF